MRAQLFCLDIVSLVDGCMTRSIPVETGSENDVLMIYQPTARFLADINLAQFIRSCQQEWFASQSQVLTCQL